MGLSPDPWGSRGLGQLAYDKGIKLLAATQADNVALESGALKHGILTYTLLKDGIGRGLADTTKDGKLTAAEWLNYAVDAVPKLYKDVREGRRSLNLSDPISMEEESAAVPSSVQQPTVFDFKKRDIDRPLISLPNRR